MATIANLAVNLTARTALFEKKMRASRRAISNFTAGIAGLAKSMSRWAAVGISVAIAGTTLLIRKQMQHIDTIAKLSDRLGVSTEFLSAFGHAAKITGTSQEAFNKSIEMFIRRLGEITQGTGEAKYGLQSLGFELDDLIHLRPDEAFLKVAEEIKNLSTQAEKAAVAYRFFGRQGAKMLNLLESDLSGVIAEAERLGITFSRLDAAKVEAANDAMTRLKASIGGLANIATIRLAPAIEGIADTITNTIGDNYQKGIIEPAELIIYLIKSGSELANLILRVDRIIRASSAAESGFSP